MSLSLFLLILFAILVALSYQSKIWQEVEPFRILVVELDRAGKVHRLSTVHLLPDRPSVVVVSMPADLYLDTSGGYGRYRAGVLLKLGHLEGLGDTLVRESMEHLLGVRFDRVSVWTQDGIKQIDEAWVRQLTNRFFWNEVNDYERLYENWLAFRKFRDVVSRRLVTADMGMVRVFLDEFDENDEPVVVIDRLLFDDWISGLIVPSEMSISRVGVVVENTTDVSGLASHWSRFALHSGYDLLGLVGSESRVGESVIIFGEESVRDSFAGVLLQRLYPKFDVKMGDLATYRADVVVRLGEDAIDW